MSVHIHIYIHIYTHTHIHIHIYTNSCTDIRTYTTHTHIYIYIYNIYHLRFDISITHVCILTQEFCFNPIPAKVLWSKFSPRGGGGGEN